MAEPIPLAPPALERPQRQAEDWIAAFQLYRRMRVLGITQADVDACTTMGDLQAVAKRAYHGRARQHHPDVLQGERHSALRETSARALAQYYGDILTAQKEARITRQFQRETAAYRWLCHWPATTRIIADRQEARQLRLAALDREWRCLCAPLAINPVLAEAHNGWRPSLGAGWQDARAMMG